MFLKPFAFLFIGVYTIGFPLFLGVVIYNNYSLIKEDQVLTMTTIVLTMTTDQGGPGTNNDYHSINNDY